MANLAISSNCNLHCPYCFTRDHLGETASGNGFVDIASFEACLDFLDRSQIHQVRLLGGEPTLHPQFPALIELARARNKDIVVFTNGLMPQDALVCLEGLPATACNVLVNINHPAEVGETAFKRQRTVIRRLGRRVLLGFNIYQTDAELDFLLSLITETGCRPSVRLGLAHPCLSGDNRYIHPQQYAAIGEKIMHFSRVAAGANVTVEFDCGFVRCMFSDKDVKTLEALGADVGWKCNPILDVDIKGRVIHCYSLSRLGSLPLTLQTDASGLRSAFESRVRPYRQAGVFRECSTCPFKQSGVCPGGCLAATLRRFRHTPFRLGVPAQEMR